MNTISIKDFPPISKSPLFRMSLIAFFILIFVTNSLRVSIDSDIVLIVTRSIS
jgi:hypothetical protein